MSDLPSTISEVCGKSPLVIIEFLISASYRVLSSLICAIRSDLGRYLSNVPAKVLESVTCI